MNCNHKWKKYTGLNETFTYCEACNVKSDDDTVSEMTPILSIRYLFSEALNTVDSFHAACFEVFTDPQNVTFTPYGCYVSSETFNELVLELGPMANYLYSHVAGKLDGVKIVSKFGCVLVRPSSTMRGNGFAFI